MFKKLSAITLLLGLMTPAVIAAPAPLPQKKPPHTVSPKRHPNLSRAQRQAENAFNSVTAAQKANEWDMAGHAAKAKELLEQANNELKQAAEAANKDTK